MRDIEWLREEIVEVMRPKNVIGKTWYQLSDNILGLIDQVEQVCEEAEDRGYIRGKLAGNLELIEDGYKNIELPEIPSYVADFIKENKKTANHWFEAFDEVVDYYNGALLADEKTKVYHYIIRNIDKYVDAYRYGYTVEEEQKYEVRCKGELLLTYYTNIGEVVSMNRWDNHLSKKAGRDWKLRHQLTEQEIKDYDERYFTFAVPVEELEE